MHPARTGRGLLPLDWEQPLVRGVSCAPLPPTPRLRIGGVRLSLQFPGMGSGLRLGQVLESREVRDLQ